MPPGRQAVKVIVSLVGPQDTTVTTHRPGTDGAAVSVRVGGALIYINDLSTAESFHAAWRSGASQARTLPMRSDPSRARPMQGTAEPVVMMDAAQMPPAHARLEQSAGHPSCIWVTHGRVLFAVHDHLALRSTLAAFGQAERVAASAFLPEPDLEVRYRAAATVRRLLTPPTRSQPGPSTDASPRTHPLAPIPRSNIERTR